MKDMLMCKKEFMNFIRQAVIFFLVCTSVSFPAHALDANEIKKLSSSDLVKELLRVIGAGAGGINSTSTMAGNELWARADAGRADAVFWRAWYIYKISLSAGITGLACAHEYDEAKKVATNEKIRILWEATAAMELIGEMHELGVCAQKSKYMAADWYITAGNQYRYNGDRDKSLQMMEKVLNLVPDHPQALKLREALLK